MLLFDCLNKVILVTNSYYGVNNQIGANNNQSEVKYG